MLKGLVLRCSRPSTLVTNLFSGSSQAQGIRCMAVSPWGHDSREVRRWGYSCSQWKELMRRLRVHGVRLPKKWILDPNKNMNMLANIETLKGFGMSVEEQQKAMFNGVFLFTKDPDLVRENVELIQTSYKFRQKKMNEIIMTTPDILDLRNVKIGLFMGRVQTLGYSQEDVCRLIAEHPILLTFPIRMIRKITQRYLDLGLTPSEIVEMVGKAHHMMDCGFDTKIEKLLRWFDVFLKADMPRILKHPDVFLSKIARLKESFWWMHDKGGFSKEDIRSVANKCPMVLDQAYQHLRIKFSFAKDYMEKSLQDVVQFPFFAVWPFRRISLRVAFLDFNKIDYKEVPLKIIFREDDGAFVRRVHGSNLEKYQHFEKWWTGRTDLEILGTLEQRDYSIYDPNSILEEEVESEQQSLS